MQSDTFSDSPAGGFTFGQINDRAGLAVVVQDLPAPDGVRLRALGSGGPALIQACNPVENYELAPYGQVTVTCNGDPMPTPVFTPTPTRTPKDAPIPPDTSTPSATPTSPPTSTPTPGGPVDISGLWFLSLTGDATVQVEALFEQDGTSLTSSGTIWTTSGSIDGSRNVSLAGTVEQPFVCLDLSWTAVAALDGSEMIGTWVCDALSGTFAGVRDEDRDGIDAAIDASPSASSNDFTGTTPGSIVNRNGLTVFVREGAAAGKVRVTAIGMGGFAQVQLICDPPIALDVVSASTDVEIGCGSATIQNFGSPVTVEIGSVLVTLPADTGAMATNAGPGEIDVENLAASSGDIIVGGIIVAPGVTELAIEDTDGDGLADSVESNTGTYVSSADTGTDPANADTDGDGLSDGLEVMLYLTDAFDVDTDDDGCRDGTEVGTDENGGGLRDPLNPWDFYDVLGPGAALPVDGVIDLPNDILGVILHFSPQGQAPYDVQFDRGPSSGPNAWNMTAPDGVIDLPNDILGVILQFNHDCR